MIVMIVLSCVLLFAISVILFCIVINEQAKREVNAAPKIPMSLCDVHGAYPTKASLYIEVPTVFDDNSKPLRVERCPFCYDEQSRKADDILKAAKEGKL